MVCGNISQRIDAIVTGHTDSAPFLYHVLFLVYLAPKELYSVRQLSVLYFLNSVL